MQDVPQLLEMDDDNEDTNKKEAEAGEGEKMDYMQEDNTQNNSKLVQKLTYQAYKVSGQ
jgi:hypothetical protein